MWGNDCVVGMGESLCIPQALTLFHFLNVHQVMRLRMAMKRFLEKFSASL